MEEEIKKAVNLLKDNHHNNNGFISYCYRCSDVHIFTLSTDEECKKVYRARLLINPIKE